MGAVSRRVTNGEITSVNFGHKNSESSISGVRAWFAKDGKNTRTNWSSLVDKKNFDLSTLTHEVGHMIADSDNMSGGDFFTVLKDIRKKYVAEVEGLALKKDADGLNKIFLGKYASTNIDEFMAEGFAEYKLNSAPSKYALQIGRLIDKYFKK